MCRVQVLSELLDACENSGTDRAAVTGRITRNRTRHRNMCQTVRDIIDSIRKRRITFSRAVFGRFTVKHRIDPCAINQNSRVNRILQSLRSGECLRDSLRGRPHASAVCTTGLIAAGGCCTRGRTGGGGGSGGGVRSRIRFGGWLRVTIAALISPIASGAQPAHFELIARITGGGGIAIATARIARVAGVAGTARVAITRIRISSVI